MIKVREALWGQRRFARCGAWAGGVGGDEGGLVAVLGAFLREKVALGGAIVSFFRRSCFPERQ